MVGLCFSPRVLEVYQVKARFPEDIVAAALPPCVPKSSEEVAEIIEVDAGFTVSGHQFPQGFIPIAHPGRMKPKRLGLSRFNTGCLAMDAAAVPKLRWRSNLNSKPCLWSPTYGGNPERDGGADRDQTDDLVVANDALYQLSYCPVGKESYLKFRGPKSTPNLAAEISPPGRGPGRSPSGQRSSSRRRSAAG